MKLKNIFIQRFDICPEKAADIARVSNGNINRAIELCENEDPPWPISINSKAL